MNGSLNTINIVEITRKTPILSNPAFGCLKRIPNINITRGCMHSCVYCYAKGFSGSPPKGSVYLYGDLPERLEQELKRRSTNPQCVSFSTASDPFQPSEILLSTSFKVMEILLKNSITVALLTKGFIPDEFIYLFRRYNSLIRARIGIVSVSESYRIMFEPYSASISDRFYNISRLIEIGIWPQVRIDPIVPNITDSEEEISRLFSGLKEIGITKVSVSCLIMRPYLYREFLKVPSSIRSKFIHLYSGTPYQRVITSAKTRLLPKNLREEIYRRFRHIALDYGVEVKVCGCKNPDLLWEYCMPWQEETPKRGLVRETIEGFLGRAKGQ